MEYLMPDLQLSGLIGPIFPTRRFVDFIVFLRIGGALSRIISSILLNNQEFWRAGNVLGIQ
jgi:hypothetical protein